MSKKKERKKFEVEMTPTEKREFMAPATEFGTLYPTPFTMMRHMAEDMERMFTEFGFGRFPMPKMLGRDFFETEFKPFEFKPPIEMIERDEKLLIRTDLPGLEREDIHVEVRDDRLVIKGERKNEFEEEKEGMLRTERTYGKFYRELPLPEWVMKDEAKAFFKNGVLEITLAIPEGARKAKKLEVKAEPELAAAHAA